MNTIKLFIPSVVFVAIACAIFYKHHRDFTKKIAREYSGKMKEAMLAKGSREGFFVYCGIFLICGGLPVMWALIITGAKGEGFAGFLSFLLVVAGIALGNKYGEHVKSAWVWGKITNALYHSPKGGESLAMNMHTLSIELQKDLRIYDYDILKEVARQKAEAAVLQEKHKARKEQEEKEEQDWREWVAANIHDSGQRCIAITMGKKWWMERKDAGIA